MKNNKKQIIRGISILIAILLSCFLVNGNLYALEKPVWESWKFPSKPVRGGDYSIAATVDIGLMNPHHWPVMNWDLIDMLFDQYVVAAESA
ncbi:MAG: hypothetical protein H8E10_21835, partial [Desulfobacterales bacterium]|nr:hypothetical protein [Desulfobacterales bacterium]